MIRPPAQMLRPAKPAQPAQPAFVPPRVGLGGPPRVGLGGQNGQRQQLEAAFAAQLAQFTGHCRNLQATPLEIRRDFEVLLKARGNLVAGTPGSALAQPPGALAGFPGPAAAGKQPPGGGAGKEVNWKGLMQQGMGKWLSRPIAQGDLEYATEPADPLNPLTGGFMTTLTCHCLEQQGSEQPPAFYSQEPRASKKLAEHEAARVAMLELFPDSAPVGFGAIPEALPEEPASKKRKVGAYEMQGDPKTILIKGLQALKETPLTKGDVVFTVEPADEEGGVPMFIGQCAVICYDEGATMHFGEPKPSKKLAEFSAAESAYKTLETVILPKMVERKEQKQKLSAEKLIVFKEQQNVKKVAKKAAAEMMAVLESVSEPPPLQA